MKNLLLFMALARAAVSVQVAYSAETTTTAEQSVPFLIHHDKRLNNEPDMERHERLFNDMALRIAQLEGRIAQLERAPVVPSPKLIQRYDPVPLPTTPGMDDSTRLPTDIRYHLSPTGADLPPSPPGMRIRSASVMMPQDSQVVLDMRQTNGEFCMIRFAPVEPQVGGTGGGSMTQETYAGKAFYLTASGLSDWPQASFLQYSYDTINWVDYPCPGFQQTLLSTNNYAIIEADESDKRYFRVLLGTVH